MKRHKSTVLPVLLVLILTGATAHAQAVTPSSQAQSLQQERQRLDDAANMARELERQRNLEQRGLVAPGQRGAAGAGAPADDRRVRVLEEYLNVLNPGQGGAWWTNVALVTRLGLTDDQKTRIERAFEAHRANIVTNTALIEKEEAQLSRLLEAEPIIRGSVLAQADRVIQARSDLERTNAAMTLEMREQLTRAQWIQLQSEPLIRQSRILLTTAPGATRGYVIRATPAPASAPQPAPGVRGGRP